MISQSPDTSPEAEKIQIELLRKSSVAKRISLLCSLSQTVMYLSRRAIKRANPSMTEQELDIAFVKYNYGNDLAERFRIYLKQRDNE